REPLLTTVQAVAALGLDVPLVAAGGLVTAEDIAEALAAGAVAAQVDLALWRRGRVRPAESPL
ncbi:MAG TPA: nitronate monooxygenase, partial [Anaerolineales bacterium]|nr:nitronate monooxygenase [Anaerolineales bacterium]